jgi:hypothetical protein
MYNAGTAVGMMMMSCYCNANEVGKTDFYFLHFAPSKNESHCF